jgi:hypothetical protein
MVTSGKVLCYVQTTESGTPIRLMLLKIKLFLLHACKAPTESTKMIEGIGTNFQLQIHAWLASTSKVILQKEIGHMPHYYGRSRLFCDGLV